MLNPTLFVCGPDDRIVGASTRNCMSEISGVSKTVCSDQCLKEALCLGGRQVFVVGIFVSEKICRH